MHSRCRWVRFVAGLAVAQLPLLAHAQTAAEMAALCRPITQGTSSGDEIQFQQDTSTMQCWGAFAVIGKAVTYSWHGEKIWSTCVPGEARRSELIAVFVTYLDQNPDLAQAHFMDVVLESLQTAFPCR